MFFPKSNTSSVVRKPSDLGIIFNLLKPMIRVFSIGSEPIVCGITSILFVERSNSKSDVNEPIDSGRFFNWFLLRSNISREERDPILSGKFSN